MKRGLLLLLLTRLAGPVGLVTALAPRDKWALTSVGMWATQRWVFYLAFCVPALPISCCATC